MKFRLLIAPPFLFALLYPVLAFDVVRRVLASAVRQDAATFALLIFYEVTRGVWLSAALLLALVVIVRAGRRRDLQPLAYFIVFATVAYGMLYGGGGFAGPFQQWLAATLLGLGLPEQVMAAIFAFGLWPLWFAVGALVRFAVAYPEPLTAATVRASGANDRTGVMRSVPGAGLDVGAAFRALVARGLDAGWFRTGPIIATTSAGALISMLLRNSSAVVVLWAMPALGIAIAITALRAAYSIGDAAVRPRLKWLGVGALASVICFAAAGVLGGIIRNQAGAVLVLILMTLAPAPLVAGIARTALGGDAMTGKNVNREAGDEIMDNAGADLVGGGAGRGAGTGGSGAA